MAVEMGQAAEQTPGEAPTPWPPLDFLRLKYNCTHHQIIIVCLKDSDSKIERAKTQAFLSAFLETTTGTIIYRASIRNKESIQLGPRNNHCLPSLYG